MDDAELTTVRYLLGSMQRALLGEVTPDLRWVTVRLDDHGVECWLVYDREITADMAERVDDIETEIIADYGGLTPVSCHAEFLPTSEPLVRRPNEFSAYRRYER